MVDIEKLKIIAAKREIATREMHAAFEKYQLTLRNWRSLVFKEHVISDNLENFDFNWPESGYDVPRQYTAWTQKKKKKINHG